MPTKPDQPGPPVRPLFVAAGRLIFDRDGRRVAALTRGDLTPVDTDNFIHALVAAYNAFLIEPSLELRMHEEKQK